MLMLPLTGNYNVRVWRDTHRQPEGSVICVEESSPADGCYQTLELKAGDALLFDGRLIHSGTSGAGLGARTPALFRSSPQPSPPCSSDCRWW